MSTATTSEPSPWTAADEVAWHELECARYRADLPLWRQLADAADGPVLDVGAGTGRVSVDLARRGHPVIAVELAATLADELRRRAEGLPITVICADARELPTLPGEPAAACIVPMQTAQLFGGAEGRARFFASVRPRLAAGALLALAIGEELDIFEAGPDSLLPVPDRGRFGATTYVSRPTAVRSQRDSWVLERERTATGPQGSRTAPDMILLDRVTRAQVEREAAAFGLAAEAPRVIPETSEYVPSTVVMLRA